MQSVNLSRLFSLSDAYEAIRNFTASSPMSYSDFNYAVEQKINLFATSENFDFDRVDEIADRIISAIPSVKRIFERPITHLKTTSCILPIESVHFIDNRTITHIAGHSELWENITADGNIKPRKLMSLNSVDTYKIYENIIFVHAVNTALSFLIENIHILREMIYTSRNIQFNLLERINHIEYFLAIGKLHTGYVRHYDKYRIRAERLINKLAFARRIISSGCGSTVYRKCNTVTSMPVLRSTNILRMHKDYHKIFLLLKYFNSKNVSICEKTDNQPNDDENIQRISAGYFGFLKMLTVFSAIHFNFVPVGNDFLDFSALNTKLSFSEYSLTVSEGKSDGNNIIRLDFFKDKKYSVVLIPSVSDSDSDTYSPVCKHADEYIYVKPFDDGKCVFADISNIDSFRRIQQVLLRGMIYSDEKRDICPFCGDALAKQENGNGFECARCRTIISEIDCHRCHTLFYNTDIKDFSGVPRTYPRSKNDWLSKRFAESGMHFRNIQNIDSELNFVCPCCGVITKR